jgi:hypothetical protein
MEYPSGLVLKAFYFQNPPGRTFLRGWRAPYKALPGVEDFIRHFPGQPEESCKEFYNFSAKKYGLVG